jgi:uncharacterized protein YybS (DUF2232 family)
MIATIMMIPGGLVLLFAGAFAFRRWGWYALAGAVPLFGVIIVVSGYVQELVTFFSTSFITGCVVGLAVKYGKTMQFILITSSISIAAVSYGHYSYLLYVKKIDTYAQSTDSMRAAIAGGSLSDSEKEQQLGTWDERVRLLRTILPFVYLVSSAIWTFVGYVIVRYVIVKRGTEPPKGIEQYRLNEYLIFPLIASIVMFAVVMDTHGAMFLISLNVLLVLSFLYLLQGFGVFKFLLKKIGIPFFIIPAAVFGMYFFGLQVLSVFLICVAGFGALDLWADFRKLTVKSANSGDDSNLN